jgi:excisionase family DNA binding protein
MQEAARLYKVSEVTIRRRIYDGTLPASRIGDRLIRIDVDDLEKAFSTPVVEA